MSTTAQVFSAQPVEHQNRFSAMLPSEQATRRADATSSAEYCDAERKYQHPDRISYLCIGGDQKAPLTFGNIGFKRLRESVSSTTLTRTDQPRF